MPTVVVSAASSIVGFTIMGLAPMPMFVSCGVLPSLLLAVTPERANEMVPDASTAD